MIKAVLFDAGHTLIHPDPPVGEVYAREAAALGARVSGEEIGRTFTRVFHEFIRTVQPPGASDDHDRAMWREITRRVYEATPELAAADFDRWFERLYDVFGHASVWRLYPDVEPAISALRSRGLRLAIVSNWDRRLRTIARELGLERAMDAVVISSEEGLRKPDPRIFERALSRLRVAPVESVHVGDLVEEDIAGARRAGLRPIFVDRGRFPAPPEIETVTDLRDLAPRLA